MHPYPYLRFSIVALTLLSSLVPLATRHATADSAIELYRSDQFDYFFFYDAATWELLIQESEPGSDYVRFSDGDAIIDYWAFDAPGMTTEDCVAATLDELFSDPAILEIEALSAEGGDPEILDHGSSAQTDLVLTIGDGDGHAKLATREICEQLIPDESLLYTSVKVPAQSYNAGRRVDDPNDRPWLAGYLPTADYAGWTISYRLIESDGAVVGMLDADPACHADRSILGVSWNIGDGSDFVIDPSRFVAVYESGETVPAFSDWLYPDMSSDGLLVLGVDEVGLFQLDVPGNGYDLYYHLSNETSVHLGQQSSCAEGIGGVTAPVFIDME